MAKRLTCEFACSPRIHGGIYYVDLTLGVIVYNSRDKTDYYGPGKSGCLLQVSNDGKGGLDRKFVDGSKDITCVGPDDNQCPKIRGFRLVETSNTGNYNIKSIEVTRRIVNV